MGIVITVDLGTSSPSEIARAAKFMLEFAGYQNPVPAQSQAAHDAAADRADRPSGAPAPAIPDDAALQGAYLEATVFDEIDERNDVPQVAPNTAFTAGLMPAQTPTLPPPPPGIEVDSQGVPWDSRIHAGSRAKIADGTWRQRRNLDPEVFTAVMAELRATMGVERRAPTPPLPPGPQQVFAPHPPVPPVPPVVVPPAPFAGSATPPAPPASGTPSVPGSAGAATAASPGSTAQPPVVAATAASPGSAPPPPGATPPTFPQLMQRITAAFTAKTLDQPTIIAAVQKVGLSSLPMLASRPDLVADVATELGIAL